MEEGATAEGAGLTLGEAKWAAVRQLGRRFPGLSSDHVEFEILADPAESDGDARVLARADLEAWRAGGGDAAALPDEASERVRALVERVLSALDLRASVDVEEDEEEIRASVVGEELGLFIGKHGQTIDARSAARVPGGLPGRPDAGPASGWWSMPRATGSAGRRRCAGRPTRRPTTRCASTARCRWTP